MNSSFSAVLTVIDTDEIKIFKSMPVKTMDSYSNRQVFNNFRMTMIYL